MADTASKSFEACLRLLRAPGDEEKFAGLLLVTKVVNSDAAHLVRVLDAVDARFLARLLRAEGAQGATMRTIALNLTSTFCGADEAMCARCIPLIPDAVRAED